MSTSKKKLSFINLTKSRSKESYSLTEWEPLRIIGHRTLKNKKRQYKVIWRPSKVDEEYSISPKYRLWLDNIKEYDAPDARTIKELENIPKKYKNESMKPEFVDGIKRFIHYEKIQTCKAKARQRQRQKYTFTVVWNTTWENAYILNETEVLQKYLDYLRDRREDGDQIPKDEYLTDSNDETTSQSSVELDANQQVHAEDDPDQALASDDDSPVHTQDNPDQEAIADNVNQVHAQEDPDQALASDDDSPVHTQDNPDQEAIADNVNQVHAQEMKTSPVPATPCNSPRPSSSNFGMSLFISTRRTFTTIDSNPKTPQRQPQCRSSPRIHALTPRTIDSNPSTPHPQCRSSPRLQINTSLKKRKQKMCKKGKKN